VAVVRTHWCCLAAALVLAACEDDGADEPRSDAMVAPPGDAGLDAAMPEPVDAASDAHASEDAALEVDARVEVFVPRQVEFPKEAPKQPFLLSEVGLYTDIASKALAPDLIGYEPTFALWSDGALKDRHLRLPAGAQIDNRDPDHWQFPVGTVLFKEFRTSDRRLETRVIARIGAGERDYFFGAFVWRDDESDAVLAWDGANDVRGTSHDVPNNTQCGTCHNGEAGRILGASALQTPSLALPLTVARAPYQLPGTSEQALALGYLHANCGHCHNPSGSARSDTDLMLRVSVAQQTVETTSPYLSGVGIKLQSFMGMDFTSRIVAGQPDQSGLYYRMSQLDHAEGDANTAMRDPSRMSRGSARDTKESHRGRLSSMLVATVDSDSTSRYLFCLNTAYGSSTSLKTAPIFASRC